jgi:hypothetical protein
VLYVEGDRRLNLNDVAGVIDLARGVWRDVPVVLLTPELKRTLIKPRLSGKSPVNGAQIKIWNPETEVEFHAASAGGRYSFPEVPPGEYLIRVEHPDKALFLGAIRVNPESHHEFDLTLSNARGRRSEVRAEGPVFPAPTSEKAKLASGAVKPARVLPQRMPAPKLRLPYALRIGGVQLAAVIRTDGMLDEVTVQSAPNEELALAALKVVGQWRYSPAHLDGVAVEVRTYIDLRWH